MLPENVMSDLISRLPVKTIIRCKCVCKKWRDLVTDPYFVHLHLSRSHEALMMHDGLGFRRPGTLKWVEIIHDQLIPVKRLHLRRCGPVRGFSRIQVGSVNGLICCVDHEYEQRIYIFNPVLEEYMILPKPRSGGAGLETLGYGFGVSTAGKYKVIRICGRMKYLYTSKTVVYSAEIEVYNLGMDHWRSLGQTPCNLKGLLSPGLYLTSHMYWLDDGQIYDLDLVRETFELFPSPAARGGKERMLGVLKGSLSCVSWCLLGLEVWVVKEGSWYKEISVQEVVSPFLKSRVWRPVCLVDGLEGASILLVYVEVTRKLMVYRLNTNTIQNLYLPAFWPNRISHRNECLGYRPSFVKLDSIGSTR
ncbi:hypothetical protein L1987_55420 [Smallanthus sonchifolius]|uniref:Uncharacterized protein n=1 Tax=Smallanthus sonchifolius TaxID=185202 RepID=A0ACB9EA68_9ASTR|nr:hypothetical protein L1987_55420 [Smallanthus sonchifolius]